MIENRISPDECMDAQKYCKSILDRYLDLLDNIVCMKWEHIQKEKEYGIIWRSEFKKEMTTMTNSVNQETFGVPMLAGSDPFIVLK